jgi:hypothetical protein
MLKWLEQLLEQGGRSLSVGRNDPCPCGSGRKYKRCCLTAAESQLREERATAIVALDNQSDPPIDQSGVAERALKRANEYERPK